jgi:hypothetical protein
MLCITTVSQPPFQSPDSIENATKRLVEADGLAHDGLDVQRLGVLRVLLEQRDPEVDALRERLASSQSLETDGTH